MSCIYADRPYTGRIPTCDAGYFNCPNNPICEGYAEYKTPTNADRIRSMSDEELARFLWEINGSNRYWKCFDKYIDWLKQPAKEE